MAETRRLPLLGDTRVLLGGEPVTGFAPTKAPALFCFLAVTGDREHHRATLASLLWDEASDEDAVTSLRRALANLRRVLDPYLATSRQTVASNRAAPYWIDSVAFSAASQLRRGIAAWPRPSRSTQGHFSMA